jgi:outer membrane immunogenic protein
MRRVTAAAAGLLISIFGWTAASAIDTSIGPQFRGWDRVYVGLSAGTVRSNVTWADSFGFASVGFKSAGAVIGLTVGKNWQNGRWVYGFEGDLSSAESQGISYDFICLFLFSCRTELNALATMRGRLGFLFTPNLLIFGTAGGAAAQFTHSNAFFTSGRNIGFGYTVGGGVEASIAPNWTVKAEYIFARIDGGDICGGPCFINVDNDIHIFRLGMNRHFGLGAQGLSAAPRPNSWTGAYLGAFIGSVRSETEWSDPFFGITSGPFDSSRTFGGINAGFNWQAGRWVYGFEGDAGFLNLTSSSNGGICLCLPAKTEISYLLTFRGRVGFLVTPETLVFATGGVAAAPMKFGNALLQTANAFEMGPVVGAGVEVQLLKDWTVKSEYLFASFGSSEACGVVVCFFPLYSDYVRVHMLRFGFNRYF